MARNSSLRVLFFGARARGLFQHQQVIALALRGRARTHLGLQPLARFADRQVECIEFDDARWRQRMDLLAASQQARRLRRAGDEMEQPAPGQDRQAQRRDHRHQQAGADGADAAPDRRRFLDRR
jgi:hypothetical protein